MTVMTTEVLTSPHDALLASYGHLVWWTVHQGIYDPQLLLGTGVALPEAIQELLTGAKGKSAWEKSTNLRTNTVESMIDPVTKEKTTYTTRDVDSTTRVLIREVLSPQDARLCTTQVGVLSYNDQVGFKFDTEPPYWLHKEEVDPVIDTLCGRYYERLGRIDDVKLRNALLNWLKVHFRVPVRGNGGIYFVPKRDKEEKNTQLRTEIFAIRDWLASSKLGTITAIEVMASETTTLDDIVDSAVGEINEEITEIADKLKAYRDNANMNAGSRAEAAKSQVTRMGDLMNKIEALEGSLGTRIGMMTANAQLIAHRAQQMYKMSSGEVSQHRLDTGKDPQSGKPLPMRRRA